jgi:3-hydroxyacyl-CoA dehydrogenase/3-hydroxy-2-methylbutyryl-CoA dehydrogenase
MAFLNTVALIGGGASGLGLATAQRVIQRGGMAAVFDLPSSKGQEVCDSMATDKIMFIPGDITSTDDVSNAVQQTLKKFNRIDLAVQTAGIGSVIPTINAKIPAAKRAAQFKRTVDINTTGTFNFVTHIAEEMSTQEPRPSNPEDETIDSVSRGVIILTASIAAMDGQRGQSGYSASKGGIVGMTLPIARDLAKHKIRINTVAPGLFDTPLLAALPEKARIALAQSVPHPKQLGNPAEYAHLIESIYHNPMMNAEVIRIDGALRMNM